MITGNYICKNRAIWRTYMDRYKMNLCGNSIVLNYYGFHKEKCFSGNIFFGNKTYWK